VDIWNIVPVSLNVYSFDLFESGVYAEYVYFYLQNA